MGAQSQTSLNQITDREHPMGKATPFPFLGRKLLELCVKKDPNVMEKAFLFSSMSFWIKIWNFLRNSPMLEEVAIWGMQVLQDVAH